MKSFLTKVGKHILGFAIVGAVIVGVVVASVSINSATHAAAQTAQVQAQVVNDGTTHDMTIVWPTGKTENVTYSETVTPKHSTYTGPKNRHYTLIDMISLNPLDSANKAGERLTPSTFAEGDRPALEVNDSGVTASKTQGAGTVGSGGSNPVMGEYLGWAGIALIGIVGLVIILGVGKWLWAEWQKVEPAVAASVGVPAWAQAILHPTTAANLAISSSPSASPAPAVVATVTPALPIATPLPQPAPEVTTPAIPVSSVPVAPTSAVVPATTTASDAQALAAQATAFAAKVSGNAAT